MRGFKVREASGVEAGLKEDRGCTDALFLAIWLLFLASMVALTVYSRGAGDLDRLIASVDGDNKMCGQAPGREDFKYLYITDYSLSAATNIFDGGVCVKKCPAASADAVEFYPTTKVAAGSLAGKDGYQSQTVLTYCIPKPSTLSAE